MKKSLNRKALQVPKDIQMSITNIVTESAKEVMERLMGDAEISLQARVVIEIEKHFAKKKLDPINNQKEDETEDKKEERNVSSKDQVENAIDIEKCEEPRTTTLLEEEEEEIEQNPDN